MITSREITDLLPCVHDRARLFLRAAKEAGIDVLVYCTYRDHAAQDALYAQGRTVKGKIVTNAKAGESWHNYRAAFDCVPLRAGKPVWGNSSKEDKELWQKLGALGEAAGLQWAGRWTGSLKETAHFQYTGGLTLADLKQGKEIK